MLFLLLNSLDNTIYMKYRRTQYEHNIDTISASMIDYRKFVNVTLKFIL